MKEKKHINRSPQVPSTKVGVIFTVAGKMWADLAVAVFGFHFVLVQKVSSNRVKLVHRDGRRKILLVQEPGTFKSQYPNLYLS